MALEIVYITGHAPHPHPAFSRERARGFSSSTSWLVLGVVAGSALSVYRLRMLAAPGQYQNFGILVFRSGAEDRKI